MLECGTKMHVQPVSISSGICYYLKSQEYRGLIASSRKSQHITRPTPRNPYPYILVSTIIAPYGVNHDRALSNSRSLHHCHSNFLTWTVILITSCASMVLEAGYPGTSGFRKVVKATILVKKRANMSDMDFDNLSETARSRKT